MLPQAPALPWPWLSQDEFEVLVADFERTGFTGGLNWYRNLDRNWELTAAYAGAKVEVPAFFLYGEKDPDMEGFSGRDPLATLRANLTDLREVVEIPAAGHLVQLERPDAVNTFLTGALKSLGL